MTNPVEQRQRDIIEEFALLPTWEERYDYLIEMGKGLPPLPERFRTDDHIVKGCQSRVWLGSELQDGRVNYYADSDALIVKGLIALLLHIFSGQRPEDILGARVFFMEEMGFDKFLSMTRANGLMAMIKQIRMDAMAHKKAAHEH